MKNTLLFLVFILVTACQGSQPRLAVLPQGSIILAFGDSLTYGTGASPETSYPTVLEKLIGYKVVNAGVPGEETQGGLARISQTLEKYHPQLVILCLGGNDLLRQRPQAEIKENLRKIILIIQSTGIQVVLIGVPAPNWRLVVPGFYKELGREMNIPVDDSTVSRLFGYPDYKADQIHFNQAGYAAYAQAIADFLKKQGAF